MKKSLIYLPEHGDNDGHVQWGYRFTLSWSDSFLCMVETFNRFRFEQEKGESHYKKLQV